MESSLFRDERTIDGYTLKSRFAGYFLSKVCIARTANGEEYVVKFPDKPRELEVEFNVYSRIRDPNILQMINSKLGARGYIVLEYAEKGTLRDILDRLGIFPSRVARIVFRQVLEGLRAIKSEGISHNDLHLDNIFLTKDNIVKIGDFGKASGPGLEQSSSISANSSSSSDDEDDFIFCDYFACATDLLSLVTNENYYNYFRDSIKNRNYLFNNREQFWEDLQRLENSEEILDLTHRSHGFRQMIDRIMQRNERDRFRDIDEILNEEWMRESPGDWEYYNEFMNLANTPTSVSGNIQTHGNYRSDTNPTERQSDLKLFNESDITWKATRYQTAMNPDIIFCELMNMLRENGEAEPDEGYFWLKFKNFETEIHIYLIQGTGNLVIIDVRLISGEHSLFRSIFRQVKTRLESIH